MVLEDAARVMHDAYVRYGHDAAGSIVTLNDDRLQAVGAQLPPLETTVTLTYDDLHRLRAAGATLRLADGGVDAYDIKGRTVEPCVIGALCGGRSAAMRRLAMHWYLLKN